MVRTCNVHGPLTESQCYSRQRGERLERECKLCVRARNTARYRSCVEEISARNKSRYEDPDTRRKILERMSAYYADNAERVSERTKAYKLAVKREVLGHYAKGPPKCAQCGIPELKYLCLDHVNNDGARHREAESLKHPYLWARRNGFPEIFQVLCHNCNIRKHLDTLPEAVSNSAASARALKLEVLSRYSGDIPSCAECGEKDQRVLTVDHVDGGGNEHRRTIGATGGLSLYRWLKKNSFPKAFQILCFNHNLGKHCLG